MNNPCYDKVTGTDCPQRRSGCAVECPKWAQYVAERNAGYERYNLQRDIENGFYDSMRARNRMSMRNKMKETRRRREKRK